jgi:hypothetical protein
VLTILLFVGYRMGLNSGLTEIQGIKQAAAGRVQVRLATPRAPAPQLDGRLA